MTTLSMRSICLAGVLIAAATPARSQTTVSLSEAIRTKIDSVVAEELKSSGAPSVSLAIVKDGAIAYANAYGDARLQPSTKAMPSMRYSIGSVSKQFTAAGILLLAEEGKLSLDDKVSKFVPDLTRANDVTIRQLLSMTAGYQDYWPQAYVMQPMLKPITARQLMTDWATKPLDFDPGSEWRYSNTNYVIAGAILEKASGTTLVEFLKQRVFDPLKMDSVAIVDEGSLGARDPERYERFAVGPLRIAPKEGTGWLYGAAELAMSLSDLAKWDISIINQSLLKPASYRAQQTTTLLADGRSTGYGLGVRVGAFQGHRSIAHDGEISGFTTNNVIFPDDRMAVAVSANLFITNATTTIANQIATLLFAATDEAMERAVEQAREIFSGFQKGQIDRTLFTPNANAYLEANALRDLKASLGPCGKVKNVRQTAKVLLGGGMTGRRFAVQCGSRDYGAAVLVMPDGKIEQYIVLPY